MKIVGNRKHSRCLWAVAIALSVAASGARAEIYRPAGQDDSVVGRIEAIRAGGNDTLLDIARRHGLGFREMKIVNPAVDTWIPGEGTEVILPTEFVLPLAPREGIVLNIPEMRLYYFPKRPSGDAAEVLTFPIGVGREGWNTPYVSTRVARKDKDPIWYPPESIRAEHAANGDPLPKRVGPGPENPMGAYAMRLSLPLYAIHGTNKPAGVGLRVSHGCIRLYPEDIEELFGRISIGTPVQIVNQPYKVGVRGARIFLEAHPYLDEDAELFAGNLTSVVKMIVALTGERGYDVNWDRARQVIEDPLGIPIEIGRLRDDTVRLAGAAGEAAPAKSAGPARLELRLDTRPPAVDRRLQ